ncbi:pirin family protein [Cochleicola gelatinilyticus]|uniref:Pirin n=1 Tax=Cochleicola gelatinilyticus TaxID=1763537 RepID=A0A167IRF2_9FLAO|nr:pirin family protein [Cochleicola gelatinilyticus]OAB79939.1 pirin [Cochleicola gelatinilyticus]
MKTVLHKADARGHANHGWLQSYHSFSFANYQNPERMHFGALRVLNDDIVSGGKGFGTHPHNNMEIISIPLEGDLQHMDNMGNSTVIKQGDVQIMSAGTGVSHSEYNKNPDQPVKFLQIWMFPNQENVTPRYDQITINGIKKENEFYQILSPEKDDEGVWAHQDAWFSLGEFNNTTTSYSTHKKGNGVYLFVLSGTVEVAGETLSSRDGFGIWETNTIELKIDNKASVLLMEVPMNF